MQSGVLYMENFGDLLRPGVIPGVARRNMSAAVRDSDGVSTCISVYVSAGRKPSAVMYVKRIGDGSPARPIDVQASESAILKAVNSALGSSYRRIVAEERLDYTFKAVKCPVLEHGLSDV